MPLHLKIIFQASVIYLWFMAWLLITAMPAIHAHSNILGMMHHSPPVSVQTIGAVQSETTSTHTHMKTDAGYKCPLCHFSPRLFEQELNLSFSQQSFSSLRFSKLEVLHSLNVLFKPARAPPIFIG